VFTVKLKKVKPKKWEETMKLFYVDTETSGLSFYKNGVVQTAAIIEIDRKVVQEVNLYSNLFPNDEIHPKALECNGLTVKQIRSFPSPETTYNELLGILGNYVDKYDKDDKFIAVGQGIDYDMGMLKAFFSKNDDKFFGSWFHNYTIDLKQIAAVLKYLEMFPVANLKLETMATYLGIKYDAHEALADIRTTRIILKHLINTNINPTPIKKGELAGVNINISSVPPKKKASKE